MILTYLKFVGGKMFLRNKEVSVGDEDIDKDNSKRFVPVKFEDFSGSLSDVFVEENYINENLIQEQLTKGEGIEFSYTGDLIPVEIVEVEIKEAVKKLKEEIANVEYGNNIEETLNNIYPIIDKIFGEKFI